MYQCGKGTYDADALIDVLKRHFGCFGVCAEFSSDFGPQFASLKFSKFLQQYYSMVLSIELVAPTILTAIRELNWQLSQQKG